MGQKYAVLIQGDVAGSGFPMFWFDVVLMREALLNQGFPANHIYVLYGDGADWSSPSYPDPRYRPSPAITNLAANSTNVAAVFNGLASGTGGYPQMTEDDLLFVWTFDHGCGPPCIGGTSVVLCLRDGDMLDTTFAALVNPIPHAFRVFCMQQCHGGGFINDLRSDRTVILTACTDAEHAYPSDTECEVVNGVYYYHGEFNYHLLSALNGQTVGGAAVNADADGNGFVTMHEVFNYIQANDSIASETPQYDDGALHLGDRLHLTFADVYLRDNLADTGREPSLAATLCCSPDINHYRQPLLDPQATLGSAAAQGQDNLFEMVEIGQPNYLYVRLRNRGYSDTTAQIDLYWTPPSTLPAPAGWTFIGTVSAPVVAQDQFLVAGPLEWPTSVQPAARGHYCLVAILGNTQDPKPDHTVIVTAGDYHNFVRNSNNVVWKNFDIDDIFGGTFQKMEFHIQGWPRKALASDLEVDLRGLPATVEVELRILKRLTAGTTAEDLAKVDETDLYALYRATPARLVALRNMPLKASDDSQAELHITYPQDVPDGAYELSALQKIGGQEMGRVTRRMLVGEYPYAANRNSSEVHVANCVWARRIGPKNKVAYRDLSLALQHGYNGCWYCLPQENTG